MRRLRPEGDIIAGHGRLAAARQLGLNEVPVIVLSGLTDLQRRQLMLADNRIALNAGWDLEMLHLELTDLSVLGADLEVLGFTAEELAKALNPAGATGLTGEDEVPELPENAITSVGDIWLAGSHRIGCGDSTDAAVVAALLGGLAPELMVTDPPYGVDYDPAWRHRLGVNRSARREKVRNDNQADWGAAWGLFPGNIAYVWHGALHATTVARSLVDNGFTVRAQIIWAKERLVMSRGIITGNMNLAGTLYGPKVIGPATANRPRFGALPAVAKTPKPPTAPRSPSNACDGRYRITAIPAKQCMTHFSAAARR